MIKDLDISIVVQGAISEETKKCLQSLRREFPNSQIILSTWNGSNIEGLDYDDVVYSEDPGAIIIDKKSNTKNNINRQLVSTKAGLKYANRKYILKTRTDILWKNSNIKSFFGKYDRVYKPKHLKNRIIVCNYYTRNPRVMPLPFHVSDWITFGNNEDIKLLYDIENEDFNEMRWFENRERKYKRFYTNLLTRYVPEQYVCINFAKKYYEFDCECFYDISKNNIKITEEILACDFYVLDYEKHLDISFLKYNPNRYYERYTLISNKQWMELLFEYYEKANKYIKLKRKGRNIIVRIFFILRQNILMLLHKLHIKEKVKRVLNKNKIL